MNERAAILSELTPPFTITAPLRQSAPFVLCSPHSGRVYPSLFLSQSQLDPHALRKSEDCYVDALFAGLPSLGAPLLSARFPRAYLDVNREPYELDPALFAEPLPGYANSQSVRVAGGLGTIARIVADGEEIYPGRISLPAALVRIEHLYKPFHGALGTLLERTRETFGYAVLIDCHSMPSQSAGAQPAGRPDIVLGDRFGTSCDGRLTRLAREVLASLGYDVQLNRPYAGGFITEHYGRPSKGFHALQIEVNRALYLDETSLEATAGFAKLAEDLMQMGRRLFQELPRQLYPRAAAE